MKVDLAEGDGLGSRSELRPNWWHKTNTAAPATVKHKSSSTQNRVGWFGGFQLSGASRTKPFEDEDYKWRDWLGGREGRRRRENEFFILYDRKYYKHFILEGKYEWEIRTTPRLKAPLAKKDWQHKLFNTLILIAALAVTNALVTIIFNWMQSISSR